MWCGCNRRHDVAVSVTAHSMLCLQQTTALTCRESRSIPLMTHCLWLSLSSCCGGSRVLFCDTFHEVDWFLWQSIARPVFFSSSSSSFFLWNFFKKLSFVFHGAIPKCKLTWRKAFVGALCTVVLFHWKEWRCDFSAGHLCAYNTINKRHNVKDAKNVSPAPRLVSVRVWH